MKSLNKIINLWNNKRGLIIMRKLFIVFALCIILLMTVGVVAQAVSNSSEEELSEADKQKVKEKVDEVSDSPEVAGEVQDYVEDFVAKRGIDSEQINKISKKSFEDLPKEVNIENVNDANLAIYEVDYNETKDINEGEINEQIYVITYSVTELKEQGDLIIAHDKRQLLNFGSVGEISNSGFLKTATGVEGSLEAGYVMMRYGSITGISTNLEVVNASELGKVDIIIYKN